jgi:3-methyladenine DNA glycosylase AlkD
VVWPGETLVVTQEGLQDSLYERTRRGYTSIECYRWNCTQFVGGFCWWVVCDPLAGSAGGIPKDSLSSPTLTIQP